MNITGQTLPGTQLALAPPPPEADAPAPAPGRTFQAFGDDGFTFMDFLDVINPLQHIPLVSTLYRSLSGDTIDPGSRIAGGTLFGGPIGAGIAVANVAMEHTTGRDMGEHVIAMFEDDGATVAEARAPEGPAETAHRDVQTHIEVRQWAEREAAFYAAQAATDHNRPGGPKSTTTKIAAAAYGSLFTSSPAQPLVTPQIAHAVPPTPHIEDAPRTAFGGDNASPGAPMAAGGWFSDTMLSALSQYQKNQRLADMMAANNSASQ